MKASEVIRIQELENGKHFSHLMNKVILCLHENHKIGPNSLDYLASKTDIQKDVLRALLKNIRETGNLEMKYLLDKKTGHLKGKGYQLTPKGFKRACILSSLTLSEYRSIEHLEKKKKEMVKDLRNELKITRLMSFILSILLIVSSFFILF